MKFSIPSSDGQIYLCATNTEDFPDWDDESLEKGIARSEEGVALAVADDAEISVSFENAVPPTGFHYVDSIYLISDDGNYELSSPLYLDNGVIINTEEGAFEIDIYTDSTDSESIRSTIFVTTARISLIKHFG